MSKKLEIEVFEAKELEGKAKEKALSDFSEFSTEPSILEETLTESWKYEAEKEGILCRDDFKIRYSLGYSQGDGVSATGTFTYGKYYLISDSGSRYCHENSVSFTLYDNEEPDREIPEKEYDDILSEFRTKYIIVCKTVEKTGYDQIEYDQSEEVFLETADSNKWFFLKSGKMAPFGTIKE
jgi:hypothetical protein